MSCHHANKGIMVNKVTSCPSPFHKSGNRWVLEVVTRCCGRPVEAWDGCDYCGLLYWQRTFPEGLPAGYEPAQFKAVVTRQKDWDANAPSRKGNPYRKGHKE